MALLVPSKPTSRCPGTSWGATSMSIYPSWKTWGLFIRTASLTRPRPPVRGVDMFRITWCASVGTELSNAQAAWTFDSMGPPFEIAPFAYARCLEHVPVSPSKPASGMSAQHVGGPIVVCQYPRVAIYGNNRSSQKKTDVQRSCFPIDLPEP